MRSFAGSNSTVASRFQCSSHVATTPDLLMLLAQRNPSTTWEPIRFDIEGRYVLWVWFKPAAVPDGMMFVIPVLLFSEPSVAPRLSVRQLVAATGLDPAQIHCWMLNGMNFDAAGGHSPVLDQLLPAPASSNLELTVWMVPWPPTPWPGIAPPPQAYPGSRHVTGGYAAGGSSIEDVQLLDAMESCWNGVVQLEVRVATIRKDLGSSIARLNSLNRDLSSDERRTCDSKDLQEWSDARRWLRDSISVLSRSVKEIDVGTTSGAGQRNRFEELHRKYVEPKIPFPGLVQAVNEFESYRKILQNVLSSAQANMTRAGRDAETRATEFSNGSEPK